jgi:ubiquitin C-terminal hydrolase
MNTKKNKKKLIFYPVKLLNLSRVNRKIENYYIKNEISNLYNACYMNSSIQCLFYLNDFINIIINYKGGNLTNATINLIYDMTNIKYKEKLFYVSEIKKAMGEKIEIYKENNQEDANEFISNYLELLHKEISNKNTSREIMISIKSEEDKESFLQYYNKFSIKKGNSFILDLFYGILLTKKYCNCKTHSKSFSSFNLLELPIYTSLLDYKNSMQLEDILNTYISSNKISNEFCEHCKGQIFSQTTFYVLPKYLIIYFGRKNGDNFIENKIDFPKEIDLKKYLNQEIRKDSFDYIYYLKSFIVHRSFGKKGHYSSYLRNGNNWIYCDDHYIEKYEKKFLTGIPIILFYEKEIKFN